jgi:hypothetical protein
VFHQAAADVCPFQFLSAGTISNITLRGFASAFTGIPVAGAGSEYSRGNGNDCDDQYCLSHFRGYFKLKKMPGLRCPGISRERTVTDYYVRLSLQVKICLVRLIRRALQQLAFGFLQVVIRRIDGNRTK